MKLMPSIEQLVPDMIGWRHHLHAHPEIGFEEVATAAFVAAQLRAFGLDVTEAVGRTGVVGTLHGRLGRGRSIGLRAELDALPMQEAPQRQYGSRIANRMHACGHDGHMAMLLGAAKALAAAPDFAGTVHFIFQPAEEGLGGALAMIADGLFDRFACDEIYALHNSERPLGQVDIHHGAVAASADKFVIDLIGRGGHAAYPHLAQNPLPAAAGLLLALQTLPGRLTNVITPAVVTVASINAGEAFNVIPGQVRMTGTVRCFDRQTQAVLEAAIRRLVASHAAGEGLVGELEYTTLFAPTRNTAREADHVIDVARAMLGDSLVTVDPPPEMGSEDFSYMLEQRPGCCFMIGQGDEAHAAVVHNTDYDFNDRLLPVGASLWMRLVAHRLGDAA